MTSKEVRPRPLIILSKEAIKNPSPIVKLYGVVEKKVREERIFQSFYSNSIY